MPVAVTLTTLHSSLPSTLEQLPVPGPGWALQCTDDSGKAPVLGGGEAGTEETDVHQSLILW